MSETSWVPTLQFWLQDWTILTSVCSVVWTWRSAYLLRDPACNLDALLLTTFTYVIYKITNRIKKKKKKSCFETFEVAEIHLISGKQFLQKEKTRNLNRYLAVFCQLTRHWQSAYKEYPSELNFIYWWALFLLKRKKGIWERVKNFLLSDYCWPSISHWKWNGL